MRAASQWSWALLVAGGVGAAGWCLVSTCDVRDTAPSVPSESRVADPVVAAPATSPASRERLASELSGGGEFPQLSPPEALASLALITLTPAEAARVRMHLEGSSRAFAEWKGQPENRFMVQTPDWWSVRIREIQHQAVARAHGRGASWRVSHVLSEAELQGARAAGYELVPMFGLGMETVTVVRLADEPEFVAARAARAALMDELRAAEARGLLHQQVRMEPAKGVRSR